MGKIAILFSGQGAQKPGMGKEFYDNFSKSKDIYDAFCEIKQDLNEICFIQNPQYPEKINHTINTQPCLYATEVAITEVLIEKLKEKSITIDTTAGFSLGEITALWFAKSFTSKEGFVIVKRRAELMEKAAESTKGAMVACLRLSCDVVSSVAKQFNKAYPVNFNSPKQTVVALEKADVDIFCHAIKENGGKAVPIAVSGGFHSPFMDSAAAEFGKFLQTREIIPPQKTIYSNKTSIPYFATKEQTIQLLSSQMNSPVLWQQTIENMISDGIDTFIEVGAGKTLCGLIKKINNTVKTYNIDSLQSLNDTIDAL